MRVLERLLDEERIGELDLGAGDDPYKRLWASKRRARIGLLAFDPLTWRGAAGALRHVVAGTLRDTLPRLGREVRAQARRHGTS
jgi:CelD/BcsL family acetyltransferase involved in cellulose biosynthesis